VEDSNAPQPSPDVELTLILSQQILALLGEARVTRSTALAALRAAQEHVETIPDGNKI